MPARASFPALLVLTLMAALVTACLSSAGLAAWADGLPDCAASRGLSAAAHALDDTAQRLGLNRPVTWVQQRVRDAEAARFGSAPPTP